MIEDSGCNLHGWAFTHGCPGCNAAEDRDIYREIRWRLWRSDWLPGRYSTLLSEGAQRFIDGKTRNLDEAFSASYWRKPHKGPLSGRVGGWLVALLNLSSREGMRASNAP